MQQNSIDNSTHGMIAVNREQTEGRIVVNNEQKDNINDMPFQMRYGRSIRRPDRLTYY